MTKNLTSAKGSDTNRVKIGGVTESYGDPSVKIEKPYTIVLGPGFSVEISRTTEGDYWVHVATNQGTPDATKAKIHSGRVDASDNYLDETNSNLRDAIQSFNVNHMAVLVKPSGKESE
jgi:hypothetical protein